MCLGDLRGYLSPELALEKQEAVGRKRDKLDAFVFGVNSVVTS